MYLSPPLSSATFTVTLQTCKPSSSLSLAHSLSHQPPSPTLLSSVLDATSLSFSLSLSLFLPHVNSHFSNMYTIPLSLSFSCSRFSLPAATLTSFISSLALFLSLSLSHHLSLSLSLSSLSLSLSLSLSISLSSAMLTHFTIFCCGRHLPPFLSLPLSLTPAFSLQSHTHTLLSFVADTASLCLSSATLTVTLQTRTLPPYLSLSLSPSRPPSLPPSLHSSIPPCLPPSLSLISHRMQ